MRGKFKLSQQNGQTQGKPELKERAESYSDTEVTDADEKKTLRRGDAERHRDTETPRRGDTETLRR